MSGLPGEIPGEAIRPGAKGQALEPGLYLVSTPIGNLRDITLRALDVLAGADRVLAEDTRVTRRLLDAYGIRAEMQPYHDHNGEKVRPQILADLRDGAVIALVSDAGTPLVSDPGFKLARAAIAAGRLGDRHTGRVRCARGAGGGRPADRLFHLRRLPAAENRSAGNLARRPARRAGEPGHL